MNNLVIDTTKTPELPEPLDHQWLAIGEVNHLPIELTPWLLHEGSLTAKLKHHSHTFRVQLLDTRWCSNSQGSHSFLLFEEDLFVRQVLLYCNEKPAVYAWTLVPRTTIIASGRDLLQLAEQPIGELLFQSERPNRDPLQLAQFPIAKLPYNIQSLLEREREETLWGRRSFLYYRQHPLLVHELFLPAILELNE